MQYEPINKLYGMKFVNDDESIEHRQQLAMLDIRTNNIVGRAESYGQNLNASAEFDNMDKGFNQENINQYHRQHMERQRNGNSTNISPP